MSKEEARIDWSLSAAQLERCIRAFNPWPMSWLEIEGQPVKVWKASVIDTTTKAAPGTILEANKQGIQVATGDGILNLLSMQPAGKKAMSVQDLPEFSSGMVCTGQTVWPDSPLLLSPVLPGIFIFILMKNNVIYVAWRPRPLNKSLSKGNH